MARHDPRRSGHRHALMAMCLLLAGGLASASSGPVQPAAADPDAVSEATVDPEPDGSAERRASKLTLAFAGDVHFEHALADLTRQPGATLGAMSEGLRSADVAMVNLESALTLRGASPTPKELEDPTARYWFNSPPAALEVLRRSGVDVVSLANNHGADFGADGLRDTLAIARRGPVGVVGVGRTARQAFTPHRVSVRGTDVALLAADAAPRESEDPVWAAGEGGIGIASARTSVPARLLAAVERTSRTDDLVVVYLHWGAESTSRPTPRQRMLAGRLAEAGADVVVGSHAHVLLGAGTTGGTYVSYGLGNFVWYHGRQSETGVLRLRVEDGRVVRDTWLPGRIPAAGGRPRPLSGDDRTAAVVQWHQLRRGTGLQPGPGGTGPAGTLPAYTASVHRIGPPLHRRMRGSSHRPGCPVGVENLRLLRLSYVGFDGRSHPGRLVVRRVYARDILGVFERLYDARFPIRRMRLVDAYGGDDDRSMAANNTSGYNCRPVAGTSTLSAHAYGEAIDINPVENPYVTGGSVAPTTGARFAGVDRTTDAQPAPGVIRQGDVVTRAFAEIGWSWGGTWSQPDYQHFAAR